MSLKVRLQLSIVALAAGIVIVLSSLYALSLVGDSFTDAETLARLNAQQVESFIYDLAERPGAQRRLAEAGADGVAEAYIRIVEQDPELGALLTNLTGSFPVLVEALVTDPRNRVVAASISTKQGQVYTPAPLYDEFQNLDFVARMQAVFGENRDYEVIRELGIGDRKVFTIRIVLSSVVVREQVVGELRGMAVTSALALLAGVLAAVLVSGFAVRPLERIGRMIDQIASGEAEGQPEPAHAKEVAAVASKLNLLGERFRGARDDAEQLRGNVDQLLNRLEEAVLLFGRDDRLTIAAGSAARLLPTGRWELMGQSIEEVFPPGSELGELIDSAVRLRKNIKDKPARLTAGDGSSVRLIASVELVEAFPSREKIGTLVTLREAEPRRQLESQLDVATRLASISRLTSGAAHEIKNPLNSIALHLEVLRSKLDEDGAGHDEIEVITREIRRLDRVVKSFLDFTRPVELNLETLDASAVVRELGELVRPDARLRSVEVAFGELAGGAFVKADRDLLKQALLNVMMNGVEAMPNGGALRLELETAAGECVIRIRDEGGGIPEEVREKIYQLYFTTKEKGSGIGLAMTFQVVQLHGGTIEFADAPEGGTEFVIRLPLSEGLRGVESGST